MPFEINPLCVDGRATEDSNRGFRNRHAEHVRVAAGETALKASGPTDGPLSDDPLVSRARSRFTAGFRNDRVGILCPEEWLAAFVPTIDERGDGVDQLAHRAECAAVDSPAGDDPKKMSVCGVVVAHQVQLAPRIGLRDLLEEAQELLVAVPRQAGLLDPPGSDNILGGLLACRVDPETLSQELSGTRTRRERDDGVTISAEIGEPARLRLSV